MTQKPLVSVVVPVYKTEAYLRDCVESICGQTYRNLRILLVDDGSPDRCPEICDEFARKDPRIRVIHKRNGGVSSARNAALEELTGKYVTFCDSDDGYDPDWIENLVLAGEREQADTVVAGHRKIFSDGAESAMAHETGAWDLTSGEDRVRYCIDMVLTDRHAWEIWSRLFRTDIIREHGLRFCETCGNFAEDLGFVLEYSLYAGKIVSIPAAGYQYRIRGDSMMGLSAAVPKFDSVNEVSMQFLGRLTAQYPQQDRMAPILHFLIMMNQYSVAINRENYKKLSVYLDQIRRREEWEAMTRRIFDCRETLEALFGKIPAGRIRIYSRYCLHRCWFRFKVERFLFFKRNGYRD